LERAGHAGTRRVPDDDLSERVGRRRRFRRSSVTSATLVDQSTTIEPAVELRDPTSPSSEVGADLPWRALNLQVPPTGPAANPDHLPTRLRTALANVRRVPTLAPRSDVVVLVVDDDGTADPIVDRLVFDLDIDTDGVLSTDRYTNDEIVFLTERRRLLGLPTMIVARTGPFAIAGDISDRVRPHHVLCCVSAERTAEWTTERSRSVGGADTLAVSGVRHVNTAAGGPWHLLATGIPVAYLDGRRSSPSLWARLAEGTRAARG
jgi:hypothetical protein